MLQHLDATKQGVLHGVGATKWGVQVGCSMVWVLLHEGYSVLHLVNAAK